MKKGQEYERFVHLKLKRLFPDSVVKQNERIRGRQSGLLREIDVSIRTPVDSADLLYIAQCKDYKTRPADIKTLGEFSSVIQDVQAAKGFLLCTSGFAQSNYAYALALGIELITIEDINSEQWSTRVEIPVLYIKNVVHYEISAEFIANEKLVEKNKGRLSITFGDLMPVTLDGGVSWKSFKEFMEGALNEAQFDIRAGGFLDLNRPSLEVQIADVWVACSELTAVFATRQTTYLKYFTPTEYSQLRDHVRGELMPLHVKFEVDVTLNESYIELPADEIPVFTNFNIEIIA
ncbi:MAG: restriction endonuclease [Fimbriimonadaceae bacterium]